MEDFLAARLSDDAVLLGLERLNRRDSQTEAHLLDHLAEVDRRRLHAGRGYRSLFAYCVEGLHFSEDMACKRIRAARVARRFPQILPAIAEGRLHLSGVVALAPWLAPENAAELLSASVHKSRRQIEALLADCFPLPDVATQILAPASAVRRTGGASSAPGRMEESDSLDFATGGALDSSAPGRIEESDSLDIAMGRALHSSAPGRMNSRPATWSSMPDVPVSLSAPGRMNSLPASPAPPREKRSSLTPLGEQRYGLKTTLRQSTYARLCHVQELLGRDEPTWELDQVLDDALAVYERLLEKRRFAATDKPRKSRRSRRPRHIPAEVRRQVWERDGGRCTFVAESGHRCGAKAGLEFDHVQPIARGGESVAGNLRLRCRTHNQFEAERLFGAGFMYAKRTRLPSDARVETTASARRR